MDITSLQNPRIKYFLKLRADKKIRRADGLMLVEGYDEIDLAVAAGHSPRTILTSPELATRQLKIASRETLTLSRAVFERISYRENPDGWLAVIPIPSSSFESLKVLTTPLVIVAEAVEKPGNLGAILRTADAAGVDLLIVCNARVDPWNPNTVRASRGAVFSVPIVECDNVEALEWLRGRAIRIVAATPAGDQVYSSADLQPPTAIVVGTEDEGLTDFWMKNADWKVKIPMVGHVNSLNVSVSTALLVYEALRQRGVRGS